jgi:hypothetical protein
MNEICKCGHEEELHSNEIDCGCQKYINFRQVLCSCAKFESKVQPKSDFKASDIEKNWEKTLNGVAFNSKLNPELLSQIIPKSEDWEEKFDVVFHDFIRNQIQQAKREERLEVYKDIYKKFDNSPLAPADFLFWLSETIGQIEKHDTL